MSSRSKRLLSVVLLGACALALTACSPYAGRRMKLVFSDEFNSTRLNTYKWSAYNSKGYVGGYRRPSAIRTDGRKLTITASMFGGSVISGGISARSSYRYGRYVFRVRTEPDPTGTMSGVVLTWPRSNLSPPEGENDMYETGRFGGHYPFYSFIHYGGRRGDDNSDAQYRYVQNANSAQWHTITMDWTPRMLVLYRDGRQVWTLRNAAAIPDVLHRICLQLDTRAYTRLSRPVRMYVDFVRIYQPA
jgi:hypothetical protein